MKRSMGKAISSLSMIAVLFLSSVPSLADNAKEGPDAKTTKSSLFYPNSQAMSDNPLSRVTNDGLDKIKAFYRKTLGPYDLIRDFASDGELRRGFAVVYRVRYQSQSGGDLYEFATVEVTMPDSSGFKKKMVGAEYILPEPLTALQQLVGRFGHTQVEYDKMYQQYQWLRYVQNWDPASDGPMIAQKYHEKIFGPTPKEAPKAKKGDQAIKDDLEKKQKKMEALNESGDIAAMIALAQEMQQEAGQTAAGQQANEFMQQQMEGMQKDSWNDWVACLKEMAAAARWVRLEYSPVGSWWGPDFWK